MFSKLVVVVDTVRRHADRVRRSVGGPIAYRRPLHINAAGFHTRRLTESRVLNLSTLVRAFLTLLS